MWPFLIAYGLRMMAIVRGSFRVGTRIGHAPSSVPPFSYVAKATKVRFMIPMEKINAYASKQPIITGLFAVLLTAVFGMTLAFAAGFLTPSQIFAQTVGPHC